MGLLEVATFCASPGRSVLAVEPAALSAAGRLRLQDKDRQVLIMTTPTVCTHCTKNVVVACVFYDLHWD